MILTPSVTRSLKRSAKENTQLFTIQVDNQAGNYGYCLDFGAANNRQWGDTSLLDCLILNTSDVLEIRSINDYRLFGLESIYLSISGVFVVRLDWDTVSYKGSFSGSQASSFRSETGNTIQIKLKGQI